MKFSTESHIAFSYFAILSSNFPIIIITILKWCIFSPTARCIECVECEGLFCPQKFVCHAHRNRERRTCHWGFDSVNWRSYLMLADDYSQAQRDGLSKSFADFKSRYNPAKRKQVSLFWIFYDCKTLKAISQGSMKGNLKKKPFVKAQWP